MYLKKNTYFMFKHMTYLGITYLGVISLFMTNFDKKLNILY